MKIYSLKTLSKRLPLTHISSIVAVWILSSLFLQNFGSHKYLPLSYHLYHSASAISLTGISNFKIGLNYNFIGEWILEILMIISAIYILSRFSKDWKGILIYLGFGVLSGTLGLSIMFDQKLNGFQSLQELLHYSLFHSISAFTSCGLSLLQNSMVEQNIYCILILLFISLFGWLGYSNFYEIFAPEKVRERIKNGTGWNILTKQALTYSALILLLGVLVNIIWLWNKNLLIIEKLTGSINLSVTAISGGFHWEGKHLFIMLILLAAIGGPKQGLSSGWKLLHWKDFRGYYFLLLPLVPLVLISINSDATPQTIFSCLLNNNSFEPQINKSAVLPILGIIMIYTKFCIVSVLSSER